MKILTFILTLLSPFYLSTQIHNPTNLLKNNKVKKCSFKICSKGGENSLCYNVQEEYNKNGELILEKPLRSSTYYFSDYDNLGNKSKTGWLTKEGYDTLQWFVYDNKNNLISSYYSNDSTYYHNEYNDKDLLSYTIISNDSSIINNGDYIIYQYNEQGNKTNESYYNNHNLTKEFIWEYDQNDILFKHQLINLETNSNEEYIYYPDGRIKSSIEDFSDLCLSIFAILHFEYRYFDNGLISQKISKELVFDFEYEYW